MSAFALLGPDEQAAWQVLEPQLRRRGVYWDGPAGGQFELWLLVTAFGVYLTLRRWAAKTTHAPTRRRLRRDAETERLRVREYAARFFDLVPAARVPLAPIGPDGEDLELRSWFGMIAATEPPITEEEIA